MYKGETRVAEYVQNQVYDAASFEAVQSEADLPEGLKELASSDARMEGNAYDANETVLFARQLETVKNRVYEIQYPALRGRQFVDVSNEAGPNKKFITYRVWDKVGSAAVISDYSTDFPTVSASARELQIRMHDYGTSFEYSIPEMREAQDAGVPLDMKMAALSREVMERAVDDAIAYGEPSLRTYGLFNHPNVSLVSLPNGSWGSATGLQMLEDLNHLVTSVEVASKDIEAVSNVIMGVSDYRTISTTYIDTAGGRDTVLQAFLNQNPGVSVDKWTKADGASADGAGSRIVAYSKRPDVLEFEMGLEYEVIGPQAQGFVMKFFCRGRWAGVTVHRPNAIKYADSHN